MGRFFTLRGYYQDAASGGGVPALSSSHATANNEHFTVTSDSTLAGNATSFWRALRFRIDSFSAINRLLFNRPSSTGWGVYTTTGGALVFECYDDVAGLQSVTIAGLSINTWYSVYVEYNGTLSRAILDDGTPQSSSAFTYAPASAGTMFVGAINATTHTLDGDLSVITGGDTLPTSAQITELANGYAYAGLSSALRTKCLFAWDMDEFSDGSVSVQRNDSVGTRHLTDVNTTPSGAI